MQRLGGLLEFTQTLCRKHGAHDKKGVEILGLDHRITQLDHQYNVAMIIM